MTRSTGSSCHPPDSPSGERSANDWRRKPGFLRQTCVSKPRHPLAARVTSAPLLRLCTQDAFRSEWAAGLHGLSHVLDITGGVPRDQMQIASSLIYAAITRSRPSPRCTAASVSSFCMTGWRKLPHLSQRRNVGRMLPRASAKPLVECASAPRRDPRSAPKNIKRGQPQTSQESPETTGDTFREPVRQGGSRLHADPGRIASSKMLPEN